MTIIKAIGLALAVIFLAVLALFGTALAGVIEKEFAYKIVKGDTLSAIAKKYNCYTSEIQRKNPKKIKNIHKIYADDTIIIPSVYEKFAYKNPGKDKYKGTPEKALDLFKESEKQAFLNKIAGNDYEDGFLFPGEEGAMVFGKDKVRFNTIVETGKVLTARIYKAAEEKVLKYVYDCGNWFEPRITPQPVPPKVETPPEAPRVEVPKKPEEPPIILKIPQIYRPPKIFKYKPIKCIDFEFNARQGFWWGEDSHGEFSYTEGGVWNSCWYEGEMIGFYAIRDSGNVDISAYEWKSGIGGIINPGAQVGVRYLDFYKKDDGSVLPHGWTAKLRLMYAKITGKNPESLYNMTQEDLMAGIYGEYIRFLSQNTVAAVTFEVWFSIWSRQESTWSGDSPSNRGWIQIGAYIQKYIDDHWAVRLGGYGFNHLWDDEFGVGGYVEGRYNDWLLAGVNTSFGFDNDFSWGPYVGVETGGLLKKEWDNVIIKGIVRIDDDGNPIKEGGEERESKDSVTTEDKISSDDIRETDPTGISPISSPMM